MTVADCKTELPLCQCGCGEQVANRSAKFLYGHHTYHPLIKNAEEARKFLLARCRISESGCWEWTKTLERDPRNGRPTYGRIRYRGKTYMAHRLSHQFFNGPVPDDMQVCHSCDNQRCINPDHLWLGTQIDNMADMRQKGREVKVRCEHVGLAKLTFEQAQVIRARHKSGERCASLAREVGLTRTSMSLLLRGITYRNRPSEKLG